MFRSFPNEHLDSPKYGIQKTEKLCKTDVQVKIGDFTPTGTG